MFHELTNHLWQSTLFAAAAGLLTLAFRKNHAQVRYWLWLSASLKFLVPFALLLSLGSHLQRTPAPKVATRLSAPAVSLQISEPFIDAAPPLPPARRRADWLGFAMVAIWLCGFGAILLIRLRGWMRIRSTVQSSAPIDIPAEVEVRSAPGLLEPGVVGMLRPVLFLPAGIAERMTPQQLEAVLAHELCHVRRRDNLFAAIHMIVEAAFWFHPLVWWIGARLIEERERACDEEVLRMGSEPQVYAEGILNVCRLYVESPLVCVSGVTGADLKRRVRDILDGSGALELTRAKKVALAIAAAAALAVPIGIGMVNAPFIRAQSAAAARPQFEVASIKACGPLGSPATGGAGGAKGTRGGSGAEESPGSLYLPCLPLRLIFSMAYIQFANGQSNFVGRAPTIEGLPSLADSDRYSINAKADGRASQLMMRGPMLQTLLEDRFKLKIHHETRELPVFDLVVAKGGLKMTPTPEGSCTPRDPSQVALQLEPGKHACDSVGGTIRRSDGHRTAMGWGVTMERFATFLSNNSGRPVIDKTGIKGMFDFQFEMTRDNAPGDDTAAPAATTAFIPLSDYAPSVLRAVAAFGLKLEPAKGPVEFLVVDHVEKPSEN
jgi:bla regulator protein BlaR1